MEGAESREGESTKNGNTEAKNKEEYIEDLFIWQCAKCLSIVGDSTAYLHADLNMKSITLKAVSCVSVGPSQKHLQTSKDGLDVGSTFSPFKCAHCDAPLGKVYRTTAQHLDNIRDYFTFDSEAVVTYKVGSYDQMATSLAYLNSRLPTIEDFKRQETNLVKMQQMLLFFRERLGSLEDRLAQLDGSARSGEKQDLEYPNNGVVDPSSPTKQKKRKRTT